MPSMSKLRFATVFTLAVSGVISWASSEQDPLNALATEDACAADDEACSLSLRQLRGEQVAATVERHEVEGPTDTDDEDASDAAEEESSAAPAKSAAAAKGTAAKKADADDDAEDEKDDDEDEKDDEDDEDAKDEDAKDEDEDDDWYGDEDEEEEKRGEFCCQHGQGKGATDPSDEGATCYPSSKPEVLDFCDNKDICASDCNGTWVVGFCAFNATAGEDACGLELNEAETGYTYSGSPSRAIMDDPCAASETACSACEGTWCHYVKTPIY